mgnify:CR=1 FL=1
MKKVLIWGRYGNYGPDYPRNRVIESVLRSLGCEVSRFLPALSATADLEYALRNLLERSHRPDLVWVPCFRQRDLAAAARYARRQRVPLVFDPLISAYDKQVNEKHKFAADSAKARKLLEWESRLFQLPDWLIADTEGHADYFHATHGVARARIRVIPVGAEESLFTPQPWPHKPADAPLELAFFGTFIGAKGDHMTESTKVETPDAASSNTHTDTTPKCRSEDLLAVEGALLRKFILPNFCKLCHHPFLAFKLRSQNFTTSSFFGQKILRVTVLITETLWHPELNVGITHIAHTSLRDSNTCTMTVVFPSEDPRTAVDTEREHSMLKY